MEKTVLVTGISGFLGGHVAKQLLDAGFRVRGSVRTLNRSEKVRETLQNAGCDISKLDFVALDLLKDDGWDEALNGVHYLQHVASPFITTAPKDPQDLIRPAVDGTSRALTAALNANVERIILTSSVAAIAYGWPQDKTFFTAKDWSKPDVKNAYTKSKLLAERKAWEIMDAAGRHDDLTTVNPAMIFGPLLDEDPGTSATVIQTMLKGRYPAVPEMYFDVIDVRDVAQMHVKAMTDPQWAGQRLPASVGTFSLLDMANLLKPHAQAYAGKLPKFQLPNWLVRMIAPFAAEIRDNVDELGHKRSVDTSMVAKVLGHAPITAEHSLEATAKSLIDHKLI